MKKKYSILVVTFCILLAADQASKLLIAHYVPLHHSRVVIPGFFALVHVQNKGAAFGLLAHIPAASTIFVVISLIAVALILVYFRSVKPGEVWTPFSLSLIVTGAVGNLIDRFRVGRVVDFLDFHYHGWHWPAFNVADASITIGVILLALKILWGQQEGAEKET